MDAEDEKLLARFEKLRVEMRPPNLDLPYPPLASDVLCGESRAFLAIVSEQRAEAVAQEREACARIADESQAESRDDELCGGPPCSVAQNLAMAIRSRSRPEESAPHAP